jgi:outer membrane protein W
MLQHLPIRRRTVGRAFPRCRLRSRAVTLAVASCLAAAPAVAQEGEPTWTQRALSAANESTSVGLIAPEQRQPGWKGWFADAWEGSTRIFREGHSDLLLPMYSWHPAFAYPNRFEQNHYSWGVGLARTLIDEKDNERIVYALGFSDSHYDLQATAGYAWIARWPLVAGLKGGLGYTVFMALRSDANYIPFPAILPLASIGTDRVMLYGSWIPFSDVIFFFARISLPFNERGPARGAGTSGVLSTGASDGGGERFRANLIYGAAAYVNTDASGIDTVASTNSWAPVAGYRHMFTEKLAMDLSIARSKHELDLNNARLGTFELIPVSLAAQYHFPSYRGFRMYAGAGVAYNIVTEQDMPGYSLSGTSVSPLLQAGFSFSLTEALVLTGGLTANFTRNQLDQGGDNLGTVQLSPVTFSLGLGYAF